MIVFHGCWFTWTVHITRWENEFRLLFTILVPLLFLSTNDSRPYWRTGCRFGLLPPDRWGCSYNYRGHWVVPLAPLHGAASTFCIKVQRLGCPITATTETYHFGLLTVKDSTIACLGQVMRCGDVDISNSGLSTFVKTFSAVKPCKLESSIQAYISSFRLNLDLNSASELSLLRSAE